MTERISFFDVDHTILGHSSGLQFAGEAIRRRILKYRHCMAIPFLYVSYKHGKNGFDFYGKTFKGLQGHSRKQLEDISGDVFTDRLKPNIFPEAKLLIDRLKQTGSKIVLATASCDFIIQPLFEYLGADYLISTSLEYCAHEPVVTTGRFEGKPVIGEVKYAQASDLAERLGVPLSECAFYSDSIHDLPLLERVGRPVAVNPDFRLRRVARQRNWEILDFIK